MQKFGTSFTSTEKYLQTTQGSTLHLPMQPNKNDPGLVSSSLFINSSFSSFKAFFSKPQFRPEMIRGGRDHGGREGDRFWETYRTSLQNSGTSFLFGFLSFGSSTHFLFGNDVPRGEICGWQCKNFASGVKLSIFTHLFVFLSPKLLNFSDGCKIFGLKIRQCKSLDKSHVWMFQGI